MNFVFQSNFKDEIVSYCDWRESLGFSDDHRRNLYRFDKYCSEFHPGEKIITAQLVTGWLNYEVQNNHSIENKCAAIRSFARHIGNDAYVLKEKFIRYERKFVPYIFTDDELIRLFDSCDVVKKRGDPFFAETAGYIFRFIYACGLRPQEARKLCYDDINFTTGEIFIRKTKLNKDRLIVASADVLEMLNRYKKRRSLFAKKEIDNLFIHTNGSSITSEQLTDLFCKCWKEANPDLPECLLPRVRVYDLRHRFASAVLQKWIDEGKNIYAMLPYLRAYMGHEDFRDTLYYVHILPENLLTSKNVDWDQIESVGLEETIWKN